ncbi:MAG TPA: hypothetical protein VGL81_03845 [Polyangiaceae bacterium]
MKVPTSTLLLFVLTPALLFACKQEASGEAFALDGNVELRVPKGYLAQAGRMSHGVAYSEPSGGDHAILFGLAGKEASNCQAFASCFPEYDEIIFRCVADGPPHVIPPQRAGELGFSIEDVTTTTLTTEDVHGIRVLYVRTHSGDDSDVLDAYVFTGGGVPADIRVFGTVKDVDRYGARMRESVATLHARTPVVWTSPSADQCSAAATRKKAVETGAVSWSTPGQPVRAAAGSLFGVDINPGPDCLLDLRTEPPALALLERVTAPVAPGRTGHSRRTRATFLATGPGDGTVDWKCDGKTAGAAPQHGSVDVHVGPGPK